jgi:hypothetical protein
MTRTKLLVAALLAAPLACSSAGNVNIGETQQLGGRLSDYAAQWDGYAEAYGFQPSGSDHIHLVLDEEGHGTVRVGTDALLPVATDPNLGFPVGDEDLTATARSTSLSDGVLYPVYAAQVQTNRIQFGLKPADFWKDWCALQTSYRVFQGWTSQRPDGGAADSDGGMVPLYEYSCLPGVAGSSGTGAQRVCFSEDDSMPSDTRGLGPYLSVDCGKYDLCLARVCACTQAGCTAAPPLPIDATPPQYPVELDGALDSSGNTLTGTLNMDGTRVTVHLQRQ